MEQGRDHAGSKHKGQKSEMIHSLVGGPEFQKSEAQRRNVRFIRQSFIKQNSHLLSQHLEGESLPNQVR